MTSLYSGDVIFVDKGEEIPNLVRNKARFIFEYNIKRELRIIKFCPDFIIGTFTIVNNNPISQQPIDLWAD